MNPNRFTLVGFFCLGAVFFFGAGVVHASETLKIVEYGTVIDGSFHMGGLQLPYFISKNDTILRRFIEEFLVTEQRQPELEKSVSSQVLRAKRYIQRRLERRKYDDPNYLWVNYSALKNDKAYVLLGDFILANAGVCREHALLMNILLRRIGLSAEFKYARVQNYGVIEDHGFNTIEWHGERWVVDSYNSAFDGARWLDLVEGSVIHPLSKRALWAEVSPGNFRSTRVIKIHDFPNVEMATAPLCKKVLIQKTF